MRLLPPSARGNGNYGVETGEIVKGIVDKLHPSLLIAIDALAARRPIRINAAIQMSDTGVAPGAGVGNRACCWMRHIWGSRDCDWRTDCGGGRNACK